MFCAAIDIHKHAFQAAVLDPGSGEVVEERTAQYDQRGLSRPLLRRAPAAYSREHD
jgi:hypothetical protein